MDGAVTARHWLEVAAQLLEHPLTRFPHALLQVELRATFEVRATSWEWADGEETGFALDIPIPQAIADQHPRAVADHPLVEWFRSSGQVAPQTLARVPAEISPAAHRQALSELLTPLGCEHQLAIPYVLGPRVHRAFVLSRPEDDFTEEDLELARLLQPLLRGLHRQTTVLSGIPAVTVQALQRIGLTAREAAVLSLAGTGMTTGSIAHRLGMAPGTVRKHLEHIHRKLGVTSRMEATQLAARLAAEGLSVSSREPGRRTLVR